MFFYTLRTFIFMRMYYTRIKFIPAVIRKVQTLEHVVFAATNNYSKKGQPCRPFYLTMYLHPNTTKFVPLHSDFYFFWSRNCGGITFLLFIDL